jgi:asparagine synthase (glutamine-hydrolysing)
MCGITGFWSPEVSLNKGEAEDALKKMVLSLEHRGPDAGGVWSDGQVGFGHRRLSVIDLADRSNQPFLNNEFNLSITFNGEIYNYLDLRNSLEEKGYKFKTKSDTETILLGYKEWGAGVVSLLRGMFAFVIWDGEKKELFIARDRLGEKPLYYSWFDNKFLFGSESKSIIAWKNFPRKVNFEAIHNFLSFQYSPVPDTAFDSIQQFPASHFAIVKKYGKLEMEEYWSIPDVDSETKRTSTELILSTKEALADAVKTCMVSDTEVGIFLSGGIDSTTILSFMNELNPRKTQSFTIGYDDPRIDERKHAKDVVDFFDIDHNELVLNHSSVDQLSKIVWNFGEPFADPAALPMYVLSQEARKKVKVVLAGDGGDELFIGYPRYFACRLMELFSFLPQSLNKSFQLISKIIPKSYESKVLIKYMKRFLNDLALENHEKYLNYVSFFNDDAREDLYGSQLETFLEKKTSEVLEPYFAKKSRFMEEAAKCDMKTYLPGALLRKTDMSSMAHGLEVRSPLLDYRLVEHVSKIPVNQRIKGFKGKNLLKMINKDRIPAGIIERKKMGFNVPLDKWLRSELKDFVSDLLLSDTAKSRNLFNYNQIEKILDNHNNRKSSEEYRIWALVNLELWFRTWIDRDPANSNQ